MATLKRIGPGSAFKVGLVTYGIIGLVVGACVAFFSMVAGSLGSLPGSEAGAGAKALGLGMGLGAIIVAPMCTGSSAESEHSVHLQPCGRLDRRARSRYRLAFCDLAPCQNRDALKRGPLWGSYATHFSSAEIFLALSAANVTQNSGAQVHAVEEEKGWDCSGI